MSRVQGVFVSGTDTGVGKTRVGCELLRTARGRGRQPGAFKPVETGVGPDGPLDALALRAAAGCEDPLEDVCPQAFALPAAPSVAARAQGCRVDRAAIRGAFERVCARHDWVLAEGAGGLRVPIDADLDMVDLASELGLPLLLVARAALGTINHTLLSLEAAERRGLTLLGVIVSHAAAELPNGDAVNLEALREALGDRLLAELPHLPADAAAPIDWIAPERLPGL
jgi:dethiobiotin synthetase